MKLQQIISDLREISFYFGLVIIILSFAFCVISFYLLYFGVPIFIVGTLMVLVSKKPIKTKLGIVIGFILSNNGNFFVFL